jgi:glutamate synthase (NADPH) large chain
MIIARLRNSTPGITLISPPPHHDIYSIEDLAQLIFDLKCTNPYRQNQCETGFRIWCGNHSSRGCQSKADLITISGMEGRHGCQSGKFYKTCRFPRGTWHCRSTSDPGDEQPAGRVKLQTDGQLKTGRDVVLMGLLGAEEFGFSTAALIVLGCVMMRKCHLNTCPVGVATQDEYLRKNSWASRSCGKLFPVYGPGCREILG